MQLPLGRVEEVSKETSQCEERRESAQDGETQACLVADEIQIAELR